MVDKKSAFKTALITAIIIAVIDYIVWVYYTRSDILDAAVIGLVVFLISYFGMTHKKKK